MPHSVFVGLAVHHAEEKQQRRERLRASRARRYRQLLVRHIDRFDAGRISLELFSAGYRSTWNRIHEDGLELEVLHVFGQSAAGAHP